LSAKLADVRVPETEVVPVTSMAESCEIVPETVRLKKPAAAVLTVLADPLIVTVLDPLVHVPPLLSQLPLSEITLAPVAVRVAVIVMLTAVIPVPEDAPTVMVPPACVMLPVTA